MRLVLDSHSQIECFDEQSSYHILSGKAAEIPATSRFIGFKIPIWTEQLLSPMLDGNELALSSEEWRTTPNFYRGEKIIFLLRDPLDTIASMMQLKTGTEKTWLENVALPVIERKMSDPSFVDEFSEDYEIVRASGWDQAAFGALYWKFKTASLIKYKTANLPIHKLSYEQLVATPELVLKDVMDFLDASWEDSLLDHHRFPHREVEDGHAMGNTSASRSIDGNSVGRWRHCLNDSQVQTIRQITRPLQEQLHSLFR